MLEKHFNDGDEITKETLLAKSLIKKGKPVKILGMGEVTKKFKRKSGCYIFIRQAENRSCWW